MQGFDKDDKRKASRGFYLALAALLACAVIAIGVGVGVTTHKHGNNSAPNQIVTESHSHSDTHAHSHSHSHSHTKAKHTHSESHSHSHSQTKAKHSHSHSHSHSESQRPLYPATQQTGLVDFVWNDCATSQPQACTTPGYDYEGSMYACDSTKNAVAGWYGGFTNLSQSTGHAGYRDGNDGTNSCRSPGPTIRLVRGKSYHLKFIKDPSFVLTGLTIFMPPNNSRMCNDTTNAYNGNGAASGNGCSNIHTHGLYVSGESNSDDIRRFIDINNTQIGYNWTIPSVEQYGGTFWYHNHVHGFTDYQVSNGAMGMLVVEDQDGAGHWPDLPNAESPSMANIQTLLQKDREVNIFCTNLEGIGWKCSNSTAAVLPDTWYRLRLNVVDPNPNLFHYRTVSYGNPATGFTGCNWNGGAANGCDGTGPAANTCALHSTGCTFHLMRQDGIWRNNVPWAATCFWPASSVARMDFAFRCPAASGSTRHVLVVGGAVGTQSLEWIDAQTATIEFVTIGTTGNPTGSPYVGVGVVAPQTGANITQYQWSPVRSVIQADTRAVVPARSSVLQVQQKKNVTVESLAIQVDQYLFTWPQGVNLTYNSNSTYEWVIPGNIIHAYHMHVYPMQVVAGCDGSYTIGEWYDTIITDTQCTVRFNIAGVLTGRVVLHCHHLAHEDLGAMTWFQAGISNDAPVPIPTVTPCNFTSASCP